MTKRGSKQQAEGQRPLAAAAKQYIRTVSDIGSDTASSQSSVNYVSNTTSARAPIELERAYTIEEIARTGIAKRTKLYADIKSGLLPTIKNGRLRRVTASGYQQYLAAIAILSAAAGEQ